jgi:hypothetical protein
VRKASAPAARENNRRPSGRRKEKERVPFRRKPIVPFFLGFVWGVLLLVAVNVSGLALAVLLVPAGALAAFSLARSSPETHLIDSVRRLLRVRGRPQPRAARRPRPEAADANLPAAVGVSAAVACPLAGLGGPVPAFALLALFAAGGTVVLLRSPRSVARAAILSVAVCLPALGTASVVASYHQGSNEGFALVAGLCAYDVGSFLMGNARGALGGPLGVAGGVLSVAVVAITVAALLDPPFAGNRPWLLYGVVAVAAPLGVFVLDTLAGKKRMPAVRRLDSYVLAAPAWVAVVPYVLHR